MKTKFFKLLAIFTKYFPQQILNIRYKRWTGKNINWENPQDIQQFIFTDYIQRYKKKKLQSYADLTDKIKVRNFVKEKIGEKYLTKLYGIWDKPEDIDFNKLPESFALKTNNGCGTNIIIRNKNKELSIGNIKKNLKKWLKFPYGALSGQPHYSLIKPKILAEEYLKQYDNKETLPNDYKIFCFDGVPKFILYYEDRKVNSHLSKNMVFNTKWEAMPEKVNFPTDAEIQRPESLPEMLEIAQKLSKGFKFVRVDLYEINGRPIFGEMTFTPDMITNFKPVFLDLKNFLQNYGTSDSKNP